MSFLVSFERVVHSVLTARIIVTLRTLGMQHWDEDTTQVESTIGTVLLVNGHSGKDRSSNSLSVRTDTP